MTKHAGAANHAPAAVMAVDVGNSKTDVALVSHEGTVLAAVRGPTSSHQQVGAGGAFATLVGLAERAAHVAGLEPAARPLAELAVVAAAGADYPSDIRLLGAGPPPDGSRFRRPRREQLLRRASGGYRPAVGDLCHLRQRDELPRRRAGRPDGPLRRAR